MARLSDDEAIRDVEGRAQAEYLASLEQPEVKGALTEIKRIVEQLHAEGQFIPDTKRGARSYPWADQYLVCRRHGIEVFVLANAEDRPVIQTFDAGDRLGVRLLGSDTWPPETEMFKTECNGTKTDATLVAGFKRALRLFRAEQAHLRPRKVPNRRVRLSGIKLMNAVRMHHTRATSAARWEDIGAVFHLSKSGAIRCVEALCRDLKIPRPEKDVRLAPRDGLCEECPDGRCAGCKFSEAVRGVEVSSKEKLLP